MRKFAVIALCLSALAGGTALAAQTRSGHSRTRLGGRVSVGGRVSFLVPAGWHQLHGWLSDVT